MLVNTLTMYFFQDINCAKTPTIATLAALSLDLDFLLFFDKEIAFFSLINYKISQKE